MYVCVYVGMCIYIYIVIGYATIFRVGLCKDPVFMPSDRWGCAGAYSGPTRRSSHAGVLTIGTGSFKEKGPIRVLR